MKTVTLGNGRITTEVAFGCGGIGGATPRRRSHALIEAAWEAGIRHFDVAPSYGFGQAEALLASILTDINARDATITTKVGIGRGRAPSKTRQLIQATARIALSPFPKIRRRLGDRARAAQPRSQFAPIDVRASVEQSLRALRRDHIDILLMHELVPSDLSDELLRTLEELIAGGLIGEVGAGSRRDVMEGLAAMLPPIFKVMQTEWSPRRSPVPLRPGQRRNFHGVLRAANDATTLGLDFDYAAAQLLAIASTELCGGQIVAQSSDPARVAALARYQAVPNAIAQLEQWRENR